MKPDPGQILLFHHFRLFLERAAAAGIEIAPLKGAHLVTAVYGPGEDRGPMCDVDFLVRPREFERACGLLVAMGFTRTECAERPVTQQVFHEAGFTLDAGPGRRILLEPHRYLAQPKRHPVDYDALWRRTAVSDFDGAPCRRLSPEDALLHAVIHLVSHQFVDPGRDLRDIERLIARGADLGIATCRAREWGCANAAWLAFDLLGQRAEGPAQSRRRALKFLVPDARGFCFPNLGLRARQLILLPCLLDGAAFLGFAASYASLRARDAAARGMRLFR
jgi:hypothetical protein